MLNLCKYFKKWKDCTLKKNKKPKTKNLDFWLSAGKKRPQNYPIKLSIHEDKARKK